MIRRLHEREAVLRLLEPLTGLRYSMLADKPDVVEAIERLEQLLNTERTPADDTKVEGAIGNAVRLSQGAPSGDPDVIREMHAKEIAKGVHQGERIRVLEEQLAKHQRQEERIAAQGLKIEQLEEELRAFRSGTGGGPRPGAAAVGQAPPQVSAPVTNAPPPAVRGCKVGDFGVGYETGDRFLDYGVNIPMECIPIANGGRNLCWAIAGFQALCASSLIREWLRHLPSGACCDPLSFPSTVQMLMIEKDSSLRTSLLLHLGSFLGNGVHETMVAGEFGEARTFIASFLERMAEFPSVQRLQEKDLVANVPIGLEPQISAAMGDWCGRNAAMKFVGAPLLRTALSPCPACTAPYIHCQVERTFASPCDASRLDEGFADAFHSTTPRCSAALCGPSGEKECMQQREVEEGALSVPGVIFVYFLSSHAKSKPAESFDFSSCLHPKVRSQFEGLTTMRAVAFVEPVGPHFRCYRSDGGGWVLLDDGAAPQCQKDLGELSPCVGVYVRVLTESTAPFPMADLRNFVHQCDVDDDDDDLEGMDLF